MGDVKSMFGGPSGLPEVSEVAVSTLRDLLERAEAGELIGVAAVCVHCDGAASYNIGGRVGGFSAIGALEMAKAELLEVNNG